MPRRQTASEILVESKLTAQKVEGKAVVAAGDAVVATDSVAEVWIEPVVGFVLG